MAPAPASHVKPRVKGNKNIAGSSTHVDQDIEMGDEGDGDDEGAGSRMSDNDDEEDEGLEDEEVSTLTP